MARRAANGAADRLDRRLRGEEILGCVALVRDPLSWSPHVGELRILVSQNARAKGLGRQLLQEGFRKALRLDLKKLIAQMTVDQQAAIALFEELGFRGEALLKDDMIANDAALFGKVSIAVRDYLQFPDVFAVVEAENLNVLKKLAAKINADAVAAGKPDPKA